MPEDMPDGMSDRMPEDRPGLEVHWAQIHFSNEQVGGRLAYLSGHNEFTALR